MYVLDFHGAERYLLEPKHKTEAHETRKQGQMHMCDVNPMFIYQMVFLHVCVCVAIMSHK